MKTGLFLKICRIAKSWVIGFQICFNFPNLKIIIQVLALDQQSLNIGCLSNAVMQLI